MSSASDLLSYYANLLILQYKGLPKASATISATAQPIVIAQNDLSQETLPLAVQDSFNLIGDNIAVGVQLDILAKYAGVTRMGVADGLTITLTDDDFLKLIQFAILLNSSGSSLSDIVTELNKFFPGEIFTFDYTDMRMSYLVNSSIGSQNLILLVIAQNLLPKPMGVQLSTTIYGPTLNRFFGFRTYEQAQTISTPFNSYQNYNMSYLWLSYNDGIGNLINMETEDGNAILLENGLNLCL